LISHVTMEVNKRLVARELEFWRCLGYDRGGVRSRSTERTEWLRSRLGNGLVASWVHLIPVDVEDVPRSRFGVGGTGHPAVVIGGAYYDALNDLVRLGFGPIIEVPVTGGAWGCRFFAESPSGWRVEVMERGPAAAWPGPPDPD
jgi:hypothetical protein